MRRGEPNAKEFEAVLKISRMDVYNCIPKINCKKWGYQVCSALAVNLFQGETKLSKCSHPNKKEYGGTSGSLT